MSRLLELTVGAVLFGGLGAWLYYLLIYRVHNDTHEITINKRLWK